MNGHIEIETTVMQGKPVIRGTRIPVELILRKLADDIHAALACTADSDLLRSRYL